MFLSFRRIVKTGFVNFWRNGFVSTSSIVVMTITLFVLGSLFFLNALLDTSLGSLKEKVDINVYFALDASDEEVAKVRDSVAALPEVYEVELTTREQARDRFKERHANDELELQALEELPDNPFPASLAIRAVDPSQYTSISTFLTEDIATLSSDGSRIVSKVNYKDNKAAIERLRDIIRGVELFGLVLSSVLITSSIIIVFNTIRMAIYISREEIAVMRLVGASDMYIRGPFVIEGMMYGVIAAIIALVSFYPLVLWLGPSTQQFFGTINLFSYYTGNFGQIFLTIMGTGMFLGALSSFLAVKKYLRV
ncbi:MAG: ABC transporter permease [Candidatus Pacebacteria bacterium]|nr:ABC transporter permease [Candidatus Paceibacterota bacterium]